jgi:hypothetical protein
VKESAGMGVKTTPTKVTKSPAKTAAKKTAANANKEGPAPKAIFNEEFGDYGLEYEAEAIKDSKVAKGERLYLVKWVGWSDTNNTWEPEANLYHSADLIKEFYRNHPDKK